MIIPMLCVTIFVILVVWFLLPRVARLMIHTPTAISIFVCLSMVQLMAVFISMRCTLFGYANHFYRSAHKFEQICRHRLRRQNVGYSNFSQPQSHLSFCVLLQYLVERRRVVTQLGKLD